MRSYAREVAFCLIYGDFIDNEGTPEDLSEFFDKSKLKAEDEVFAKNLFTEVRKDKQKYLNEISELSVGYKIERINKVEQAILCLAMYEIDKGTAPEGAAIDEAVKLSKKYSGEKSAGFVNGILSNYLKSKKQEKPT